MEVILNRVARVSEEIDKSSLLDEVILRVDADIFNLLLRGHEPLHLQLLSRVGPLRHELLGLISSVHIVEVGKLGSNHEGKMTHL